MLRKTFRGGVHPKGNKGFSKEAPLTTVLPKGDLVYPLSQHIGKPAAPVVKKGDPVLVGQMIAKADGFVSAHIFSGASGTVKGIEMRTTSSGMPMQCIVIKNDGEFNKVEGMGVETPMDQIKTEDILKKISDAGIVGLGGAGFPTHVKLAPKNPESIRYIVANGAECEPYITCDNRLMIENPEWVLNGLRIVLKLFPNAEGIIAIEDNKPEAIQAMKSALRGDDKMRILPLKTKYPQGGERGLVYAVTGQRMASRDLPANLGCVVDNVSTLAAIYRAVCFNEPLIEKGFTVTGDAIANPMNLRIRIGTSIQEVIEAAGGFKGPVKKIILGGPMMGTAIAETDVPLVKANNAIVCMSRDYVEEADAEMTACIRCGRCVHACPLGLSPQLMAVAAERKDYKRYADIHGCDCIACGCCTYVCPAKRPLMQVFKATKPVVLAEMNKGAK